MAYSCPKTPSAKDPDGTSQATTDAMRLCASPLRRIALQALSQLGEATMIEAIPAAGVPRESLLPRFSELRTMGLVEATAERRPTPSGKSAAVLRLTGKGRAMLCAMLSPAS
jgi:hypothetical protein